MAKKHDREILTHERNKTLVEAGILYPKDTDIEF